MAKEAGVGRREVKENHFEEKGENWHLEKKTFLKARTQEKSRKAQGKIREDSWAGGRARKVQVSWEVLKAY